MYKKKRKVKRCYRKWREKKINRGRYLEERRKMKKFFEKQQEERRRKMEELKGLRNELEVWKYINKRRNIKEGMENNISKEEWRKYFMKILEGEEKERTEEEKLQINSGSIEEGRKEKGNKELNKENKGIEEAESEQLEEEELKEEEINEAIHKMKMKKASGVDEIPMEDTHEDTQVLE